MNRAEFRNQTQWTKGKNQRKQIRSYTGDTYWENGP